MPHRITLPCAPANLASTSPTARSCASASRFGAQARFINEPRRRSSAARSAGQICRVRRALKLADHFSTDASGTPLLSNGHGVRPDPNRRDPLLVNWALPRQRKRHLEIFHKRRMSALCIRDLKRVRATEVTGRRANTKAVLGSKPAIVYSDAPDRELSTRPFANVSRDRRTRGGSSQLDLEDRREHSLSELGDQVDVIPAKRLIHVVNRCAKFDQASATRRE